MVKKESFLIDKWEDFVDWDKRKKGEDGFIRKQLEKYNCKTVYDLALGIGYDSIELIKSGFDVTSNEIDAEFLKIALENARKHKVNLKTTSYDWREINIASKFDAAIILGNSICYIHNEEEQKDILSRVNNLLKREGIFIIDHRNYEYILSDAENILKNPKKNFRYSRKINYCGDKVIGYPIKISQESVLFEYLEVETGKKSHIDTFPILEDKLKNMLLETRFKKTETYYDYKPEKPEHYDFVQHIALK